MISGKRILIAAFVSLGVAIVVFNYLRFGPHAREVDIVVQVKDGDTGKPVPYAKIEIFTDCYYLLNNAPRKFYATTDERGQLYFKQAIDYAVREVVVIAWNKEMTKRSVVGKTQDLMTWLLNSSQERPNNITHYYTPLYASHGQFQISIKPLTPHALSDFRMWYKTGKTSARITIDRLMDSGITVDERVAREAEEDN
jgi:hypothetical protein